MPNSARTWLKSYWAKVVTIIVTGGTVFGLIEGSLWFAGWVHSETEYRNKIETLIKDLGDVIKADKDKDKRLDELEAYREKNKGSFAVGFRVTKVWDETLQKWGYKKFYRDWSGYLNEIHYDAYMSSLEGYPSYFYIDRETGDKIYVY
jgi:hypothetical protein